MLLTIAGCQGGPDAAAQGHLYPLSTQGPGWSSPGMEGRSAQPGAALNMSVQWLG